MCFQKKFFSSFDLYFIEKKMLFSFQKYSIYPSNFTSTRTIPITNFFDVFLSCRFLDSFVPFSQRYWHQKPDLFQLDSTIKNESIIIGFFWSFASLLRYRVFIEVRWRVFLEHQVEMVAKNWGRHISRNPDDDVFILVFSLCWIFPRLELPRKREEKVHCRTLLFFHSRFHNSGSWPPIKLKLYVWMNETREHIW